MSDYRRLCTQLAQQFNLDSLLLARSGTLHLAFDELAPVMTVDEIVHRVVQAGSLSGAINPYGVAIDRVQRLARDLADREIEPSEQGLNTQLPVAEREAIRRGETLAMQVRRGHIDRQDAERTIEIEFVVPAYRALALQALAEQLSR